MEEEEETEEEEERRNVTYVRNLYLCAMMANLILSNSLWYENAPSKNWFCLCPDLNIKKKKS